MNVSDKILLAPDVQPSLLIMCCIFWVVNIDPSA